MSTLRERSRHWKNAKEKGFSSRWTYLQEFSDPGTGTIADTIADIDNGWEAAGGDGFVPGQSGEEAAAEPVPSGVTKTDDQKKIPRARVNVDSVTAPPMVISGDNRNVDPSKVRTIDISELKKDTPERKLVLELARKNPNYIKLV
jgi:hypothetical protein